MQVVFFITPQFSDWGFVSKEIDLIHAEQTRRPVLVVLPVTFRDKTQVLDIVASYWRYDVLDAELGVLAAILK